MFLSISFNSIAQESSATVKDIDGNVYKTVQIGNQLWMTENLKTTKYNDGTPIPNVIDDTQWENLTTGAYSWSNHDAANKNPYGALYNWYAVETGKLCPTGWHVASDKEWTTLMVYLGGYAIAGGKLKDADTTYWGSPNKGATNESGFTAIPGGWRNDNGAFSLFLCYWWTSSTYSRYTDVPGEPRFYVIFRQQISIKKNHFLTKGNGLSVRCIKD